MRADRPDPSQGRVCHFLLVNEAEFIPLAEAVGLGTGVGWAS